MFCCIGELLNVFVICLGMIAVLLLNVMVLFWAWVSLLLPSYGKCVFFVVPLYVCFVLWYEGSYCRVNFLKFGIMFIFGAAIVNLSLIFSLMCSDNNLHASCILPVGM